MIIEPIMANLGSKPEEEFLIADALSRLQDPSPIHIKDWRGFQVGTLTIIGFSHTRKVSGGWAHHWLARCRCGLYELRRHKTLGRGRQEDQACESCKQLARLRWRAQQIH